MAKKMDWLGNMGKVLFSASAELQFVQVGQSRERSPLSAVYLSDGSRPQQRPAHPLMIMRHAP